MQSDLYLHCPSCCNILNWTNLETAVIWVLVLDLKCLLGLIGTLRLKHCHFYKQWKYFYDILFFQLIIFKTRYFVCCRTFQQNVTPKRRLPLTSNISICQKVLSVCIWKNQACELFIKQEISEFLLTEYIPTIARCRVQKWTEPENRKYR